MNCWPWTFLMLSFAAFQLCVWPSMIKISSPLLVRYIGACSWSPRRSVFDVLKCLVQIAKQYHGVIVNHYHAAVMGGGADLEQIWGHLPPQRFGDLRHLEFD